MTGVVYEEATFWAFLLITLGFGGGAAWLTGRAVAITWRPYWMALAYMILLAGAVRFLHFALFEGSLLTARFFLVDLAVLAILSTISYRVTRVRQMTSQYPWLYEAAGPFAWRKRA